MSAITLNNVWKEFGDHIVLEDISIDVPDRSFLVLVGASGCGKTTFLRMLLSQELPTRGDILLDGRPIAHEPDAERGVVFQRYSVFPHLTVLGNVMLGAAFRHGGLLARLRGDAARRGREEAEALLAEVGLAGFEDRYPASLSGGMQQRLALAQAIMTRPRVLLLDEPFGALDPGTRAEIHALMKRLWNSCEMTVVMVTHDISEAFKLATRVVAFERPRDRPEEQQRYGARIGRDIVVWPPRVAGGSYFNPPGRDDAALAPGIRRDDPAPSIQESRFGPLA